MRSQKVRLVSLLIILLIAGLAYLLGWSNSFTVKELSYSGAPTKASQKLISDLAQIELGDKLARLETRKISARIAILPWIKSSDISRNWISGTVKVVVSARTPIATFNGELMDISGTRFELPGGYVKELPSVFAKDTKSGLAAIKLFLKLPAEFSTRTSVFTASSTENIFFNIKEGKKTISVVWGAPTDIALKLRVYTALLTLPENSKVKKIDLTDPKSPIVK